jgi:hypothetical protein
VCRLWRIGEVERQASVFTRDIASRRKSPPHAKACVTQLRVAGLEAVYRLGKPTREMEDELPAARAPFCIDVRTAGDEYQDWLLGGFLDRRGHERERFTGTNTTSRLWELAASLRDFADGRLATLEQSHCE